MADNMIQIKVWLRADGMIEIEGTGRMRRYRSQEEADAYLAGLGDGLDMRNPRWSIDDRRPIRPALPERR